MIGLLLAATGFVFALIPAILYAKNVRLYRTPALPAGPLPAASILIPARNESRSIASCVQAVRASQNIDFEIIVLDDHSEDDTAAIVREIAKKDARVRLETAPPLPVSWCGKQHACFVLSKLAKKNVLVFLDADVCLAPDGLARMIGFLDSSKADLVSGFPRQETVTFLEKLVLPLIHFLLLGFLPLSRMRTSRHPAYASGCGQFFVAHRTAYEAVGGHGAIMASLHDGITLPRAFRKKGYATDLGDETDLAVCRMYRSAKEVWYGLAKNAREGLAANRLIVPATMTLLAGQLLPFVAIICSLNRFSDLIAEKGTHFDLLMSAYENEAEGVTLALGSLGVIALYYPRLDGVLRFRQSLLSAVLHPLGIVVLLAIQWFAVGAALLGKPSGWKGRHYQQTS